MKIEQVLNEIDESSFENSGFAIVIELCGLQTAKDLIKHIGGLHVYVPQYNSKELITPYIIKRYNEFDNSKYNKTQVIQKLVLETGVSEHSIYKILNSLIETKRIKDHFR